MDPQSQLTDFNLDPLLSTTSLPNTAHNFEDLSQWDDFLGPGDARAEADTRTYESVPSNANEIDLRSVVDETRDKLRELQQAFAKHVSESEAHRNFSNQNLESVKCVMIRLRVFVLIDMDPLRRSKVKNLEIRVVRHHGPRDSISPAPTPLSPLPSTDPTQAQLSQDQPPISTNHGIMFSATACV